MDKRICDVCGTENEMHYQYCKNCGTKLQKPTNNENQTQPPYQQNNVYTASQYAKYGQYANQADAFFDQTYGITEIDGVKTEDLAAYIGPKNRNIINKFAKMELSNSKVSWCWPAALWGILGPAGVAVWFIYRKMYKLGIILLAISVMVSIAVTTVSGEKDSVFDDFSIAEEYAELEEIPEIEKGETHNSWRSKLAVIIDDMVVLASITLAGLFSMYAYKNHTINKINHYNIVNASERYRQIGLMAVGGTSVGMAVLAPFVCLFVEIMLDEVIYMFF